MSYFEFFSPVKICAGENALEHLPFELEQLGSSRPFVITDKGVCTAGLTATLTAAFAESSLIPAGTYDEVPPDSSLKIVKDCAELYRQKKCDAIIAVGGGSVLDTAKGVNILVSKGGTDLRKYSGAGILQGPLRPFIAVPTTCGTGSEATLAAVIRDEEEGRKLLFSSHSLMPDAAIIDVRMTLTLPPAITAATGMDAFTHAVESYVCLARNPLSDSYSAAALKILAGNLIRSVKKPKDKEARFQCALAATMAGIAFSNSMVGLVHAAGHSVGAVCGVPHGTAMSILLPHVLRFNLEGHPETAGNLSELFLYFAGPEAYAEASETERCTLFLERLDALREDLYTLAGLPRTLEETGKVSAAQLEEIAEVSMGDASGIFNPVEYTKEDVVRVLKNAFTAGSGTV
jgi:alcohol dehydrogenase